MTDEIEYRQESMPLGLKVVRGLLWFQAVSNFVATIALTAEVVEGAGRGRDEVADVLPGLVGALVAFLMVAVLTVCALGISWRTRRVRTTIIVFQAVNLVAGVVAVFTSDPVYALIGVGLAALILVLINRRDVEAWFDL
ncbi:hypothetical protein B0I31_11671 [Saccharothrix carnea]|uniref:Integral membrane protein n=2 Tax=Saccharothrix carnea TaxID=1280637 RepID=A0A2P8I0K9_SACCR|nr:hypothetical protein B0I31_11671 [Saccharothrix carnea]